MHTTERLNKLSPNVRDRVKIERRIVKHLVRELLEHNVELSVHDGEEHHAPTRDAGALFDQLMETDSDTLYVHLIGDHHPMAMVMLVYGNDGWDVMSDYSISLEHQGLITKTIELTDSLGG